MPIQRPHTETVIYINPLSSGCCFTNRENIKHLVFGVCFPKRENFLPRSVKREHVANWAAISSAADTHYSSIERTHHQATAVYIFLKVDVRNQKLRWTDLCIDFPNPCRLSALDVASASKQLEYHACFDGSTSASMYRARAVKEATAAKRATAAKVRGGGGGRVIPQVCL